MECWINPISVSAIQVIATCRNSGTGDGWLLFVSASGAIGLQGTTGSPSAVSSAVSAVTAGEWSHIAVCKSGSTSYVFVNGALVASGVIGIGPSASETLYIGRHHLGAGYDFYGYIDDLRITNGVGRYLEAFTPQEGTRQLTFAPAAKHTACKFAACRLYLFALANVVSRVLAK